MKKPTFIEKQYLGRDYIYTAIRLVIIAFCFAAYIYERDRDHTQDLYIIAGFTVLGISILMLFIKHYQTTLTNQSIIIDGSWSSSKVKIDLKSILTVKKDLYSPYFINTPVYNLHRKGSIRFYTSGKYAIVLTDRDGLLYIIGTQRPNELLVAIENELKVIENHTELKNVF